MGDSFKGGCVWGEDLIHVVGPDDVQEGVDVFVRRVEMSIFLCFPNRMVPIEVSDPEHCVICLMYLSAEEGVEGLNVVVVGAVVVDIK